MSAFLVSDKHINTLVHYAAVKDVQFHFQSDGNKRIYNPRDVVDAKRLCEILKAENVRSLLFRYSGDKPDDYDYSIEYNLFTSYSTDPLQIIKACECLDYQSCETDNWKDTDAFRMLDWIKECAISSLPNYDKAKWEID